MTRSRPGAQVRAETEPQGSGGKPVACFFGVGIRRIAGLKLVRAQHPNRGSPRHEGSYD